MDNKSILIGKLEELLQLMIIN